MKRLVAVGIAALTWLVPLAVLGSHWGMEYAEPLGWDPVDQKAFFLIHRVSESGHGPIVVYFDVDGQNAGRPVQVGWSKARSYDDSLTPSKLQDLRRRLRPLKDLPSLTVFHHTSILKEDSVASVDRSHYFKRYRISVRDLQITDEAFEVTTLSEPVVRMIRRLQAGDNGPFFGILSFRGVPIEIGYETQVPVLLSSPSPRSPKKPPTKIGWIRWE